MVRKLFIGCLIVFLISACSPLISAPVETENQSNPFSNPQINSTNDYDLNLPDQITENQVKQLLLQMTLEEKIGQMTQVEKNSIKTLDITRYYIGSILSGGGGSPYVNSINEWVKMIDGFQKEALSTRLSIPIIYGVDAIHGHANLYGATVFPQPIGLGATRNSELVREIGQATAIEMLATGTTWNFAPILAVPQDIRWGRTYESYSENTQVVTELGTAYLQGLQSIPVDLYSKPEKNIFVLATPKHYLGDGGTAFGTATQFIFKPYLIDQGDMTYDEASIRAKFLPPYQKAVESGALSIMISFSSWNGLKMHAQQYWIEEVLKGELSFQGFVVSDWGGIDQISDDYYSAVVTGINAGIDMNMVPYDYVRFIDTMKQAVENEDISLDRIDDAVQRILTVKYKLGLFESPYTDTLLMDQVGSEQHKKLARQAVRESVVLLKNDNDVLPLSKSTQLVYIAGQAADDIGIQCGGWTIEWQGKSGDIQPGTTILEGFMAGFSPESKVNYDRNGDFQDVADVGIVVVGEKPYAEGVGDANDLSLSADDIDLIERMRKHSQELIVIIISGRPMIITSAYQLADAWVAAWLPGTEGAGVADVILGDYAFTGKLAYTWPRSMDQLPINLNTTSSLDGCDAPLFSYGYGLGNAGSASIEWLNCD
ncbi:MAG: glycoside hydrolase family 3 protein [Anaerolineaceae bacterium]|nr:glycoside hydrolase family 3 protein [Anaerolineaceae bacterium]